MCWAQYKNSDLDFSYRSSNQQCSQKIALNLPTCRTSQGLSRNIVASPEAGWLVWAFMAYSSYKICYSFHIFCKTSFPSLQLQYKLQTVLTKQGGSSWDCKSATSSSINTLNSTIKLCFGSAPGISKLPGMELVTVVRNIPLFSCVRPTTGFQWMEPMATAEH